MRIVGVTAHVLRWRLDGSGAARGRSERAAVLVELRSDDARCGLGEAAPLPGMSVDTLDDAQRALASLPRNFAIARFEDIAALTRDIASPAARFAIETALGDLLARRAGISLGALLGAPDAALPIAAVVDDVDDARRAYAAGIRSLKLKLGPADALDRVHAIAAIAPDLRLRIDANRSWPRAEVADRLRALAALPIDYVEEPCADAHTLLATSLAVPLALDESLAALDPHQRAAALPHLAAVVLKPTLLGLVGALAIAAEARRARVAAVVSHGLEGPIGTAACIELARAVQPAPPPGLAPHAGLAGWRLTLPQLTATHVRQPDRPGLGLSVLAEIIRAAPQP